jgi:hypothetical protein
VDACEKGRDDYTVMPNELDFSRGEKEGLMGNSTQLSSSFVLEPGKFPFVRLGPALKGLTGVWIVVSRLGSSFGRVKEYRVTFSQPEDANNMSENAVAAKGMFEFWPENVVHRTTAIGRTYRVRQQVYSTCMTFRPTVMM